MTLGLEVSEVEVLTSLASLTETTGAEVFIMHTCSTSDVCRDACTTRGERVWNQHFEIYEVILDDGRENFFCSSIPLLQHRIVYFHAARSGSCQQE